MSTSLLLVADVLEFRDLLAKLLIKSGYHVVCVGHPRHALEAISFQQFNVAVIDLNLPEMDGIELMKRLKRRHANLQVILMSSYCYPLNQAKSEGAFACLEKPFRFSNLGIVLESALESTANDLSLLKN